MEATIEKLVDNLEKEKGLNQDEKIEMDRVLRTAAKGIEIDRIADFVKSMRQKIDAPVSKIFTKEGINFESLEGAAQTEAKIVIKIQNEYAEKRKQENQQSNITDEKEKAKAEEKEKQPEKENIIAENESYLDDYMPNLGPATKQRVAEGMYKAKVFTDEVLERVGKGEDEAAVRKDISNRNGENEVGTAIRELYMAINLQKDIMQNERANEQGGEGYSVKTVDNVEDVIAFSEESQEIIKNCASNGEITVEATQEFVSVLAANAIDKCKKEIARLKNEIEKYSKINDHPDKLKDLFEQLEDNYKNLRDSMQVEEEAREQLGDKAYVDKKRAERGEYLKTAVQRYFGENNRESIVMIFEDMKAKAENEGIDLEEIIGFDDILESVLLEMNRYPGQSGNVDTIKKCEETFFKNHREEKALKIVKENVDRKKVESAVAGDKRDEKRYNDISIKYARRMRKNSLDNLKNIDENVIKIKKTINEEQTDKKRKDEIIRNVENVDIQKMKEIKDRSEFISYATKLYFSSGINVLEIYGMFRENCVSMGIGFKDIREAVVQETIDAYTSANYANIRSCENEMRRQSELIAKLKEANKKAEQKGNLDLIDKNNQKIAKCQKKIEEERNVTRNIKKAVIYNRAQKKKDEEVKNSNISTLEPKQEKKPEPKRKKGLFGFLRRAIPKKEIEPKDVNEEVAVLNDLQKEELQEDKEQPKAVNENKTNNQLEVSTISVEGDELATETANKPENETKKPDVGDGGR